MKDRELAKTTGSFVTSRQPRPRQLRDHTQEHRRIHAGDMFGEKARRLGRLRSTRSTRSGGCGQKGPRGAGSNGICCVGSNHPRAPGFKPSCGLCQCSILENCLRAGASQIGVGEANLSQGGKDIYHYLKILVAEWIWALCDSATLWSLLLFITNRATHNCGSQRCPKTMCKSTRT